MYYLKNNISNEVEMSNNILKKAIAESQKGGKFPVMQLVRDDPVLAATISKMVTSQEPPRYGADGNRDPMSPNMYMFHNSSDHTAQNISDARTVMQVLPDMELAAQVLVSSIISPKDMVTTELTYTIPDGLIAPDVSAALIDRTRTYFETDYKIKPLMSKMLRNMLFETGSYPIAVIPENSIDELINGHHRISFEALSHDVNPDGTIKSIGLLGPAEKDSPTKAVNISFESLNSYDVNPSKIDTKIVLEELRNSATTYANPVDTFVTVTDNINVLKIPRINQKIREDRIKGMVGSKAMESISSSKSKFNDREMSSLIYKERQVNFRPLTTLKTQEQLNRNTVGNPLIIHLPSEAVIPVFMPGCPEEQVGFFVLIDIDGNPVSKADDVDYYQQLSSRLNSNGSFPSAMLNHVKQQMTGFNIVDREHINYAVRSYSEMVEKDLLARLRNGVYGNGVALAKNTEIYRLMFSRTLAKQHTQLLFIPVELMTYFAFDYTPEGIGKSLLDDMKILNSLRSMLTFANVMASIRNSIGRTEVKIKLDESDPNPQKTIETTIHEIVRSRQQYFPLGTNSPTDLTMYLQRAGYEFTFEGHPGLPDVAVDFGEKNSNFTKPDPELEESLRKRAIMATGLSPDSVDATFQAEFASSIVANNILLSKRVVQTQEKYTPQLTNHMRKVLMNSEEVIRDLKEILFNNFDKLQLELTEEGKKVQSSLKDGTATSETKYKSDAEKNIIVNNILNEYLMNFEVSLPMPNSVTLENQMTAMETYTKALDAAIEAWISEKFFTTDDGGQIANQVGTIKEVIRAYYLRKWMAENGVMTELADLTMLDGDGKPSVDIFKLQEAHISGLTKSLTRFMVGIDKVKKASDTVMNSLGGMETEAPSSNESSGSDGGSGPDDDGLGGSGDFDLPDFDGGSGPDDDDDAGNPPDNPPDDGTGNLSGEPNEVKEDKPASTDEASADKKAAEEKPAGDADKKPTEEGKKDEKKDETPAE